MARYPISHNAGKHLGVYFEEILKFHIPPSRRVPLVALLEVKNNIDYPMIVEALRFYKALIKME